MQDDLMSPESSQYSPMPDGPSIQQPSITNQTYNKTTGRPPSPPTCTSHAKSVSPAASSKYPDTSNDKCKRPISSPVTDRPAKQPKLDDQDPQPPNAQQPARNATKPIARKLLLPASHGEYSMPRVHHQSLTTVILPANTTRQPSSKEKYIHQSIGNHVVGSTVNGKKLSTTYQGYLLTRHRHGPSALSQLCRRFHGRPSPVLCDTILTNHAVVGLASSETQHLSQSRLWLLSRTRRERLAS